MGWQALLRTIPHPYRVAQGRTALQGAEVERGYWYPGRLQTYKVGLVVDGRRHPDRRDHCPADVEQLFLGPVTRTPAQQQAR